MTAALPPAIFLMGPTAAGKTEAALHLARALQAEIISVDSAQVYRGLDIGSAKPDAAMRAAVPHHLLDVCDPAEAYNAGRFRSDALRLMADIRSRGAVPMLAGGTGLYFRALEQGLSALPPADTALRAELDAEAARLGWPALHQRLATLDPVTAARLKPRDAQRIQRALEVCLVTGRPYAEVCVQQQPVAPLPWRVLKLVLLPGDRGLLTARIAARFDAMLAAGFADEVRRLHARGDLHPGLPAIRSVGYRQLWDWLEGRCGEQAAVTAAVTATRQLAKRQLTWLRRETGTLPFDAFSPTLHARLLQAAQAFLHGAAEV
jgi:tRNA dimethylallyltransferase